MRIGEVHQKKQFLSVDFFSFRIFAKGMAMRKAIMRLNPLLLSLAFLLWAPLQICSAVPEMPQVPEIPETPEVPETQAASGPDPMTMVRSSIVLPPSGEGLPQRMNALPMVSAQETPKSILSMINNIYHSQISVSPNLYLY